jgi:hypothetical protein
LTKSCDSSQRLCTSCYQQTAWADPLCGEVRLIARIHENVSSIRGICSRFIKSYKETTLQDSKLTIWINIPLQDQSFKFVRQTYVSVRSVYLKWCAVFYSALKSRLVIFHFSSSCKIRHFFIYCKSQDSQVQVAMALDFTAETIIVGSKGFQIWIKRNFDFYSYWLNFGCLIKRIHDIVYGRSQFLKFAAQRN